MNRRLFLKFNIFLSLMVFFDTRADALVIDDEIVIIDGWILKKSDLI